MTLDLSRRAAVAGAAASALTPASAAAAQDTTVLFDTVAHLDETQQTWVVPLHAWVYRAQNSQVRKALIARLLKQSYDLDVSAETQAIFDRRINLLLADNLEGQRPSVTVAGAARELPPTGDNGHSESQLRVPLSPAAPSQGGAAKIITMGMRQSAQTRAARAHFVPPEGVSIISDIDDTVKVSNVLDKAALFRATFLEPFKVVPGMPELLKRIAGNNAPVHYVSSSPWHLYAPLREWFDAAGLPVAALHLKQMRLKDRTILDILKSPAETKPPVISAIFQRFPRRKFVLVGDSGEKDPEVYAGIARRYPQQVGRILIRRAPGDRLGAQRLETAFAALPRSLWQAFDDPSDVK